jgi:V/A-type H+-transporting ATPase subunit I
MKHVLIQALTEDLPRISLALADMGIFDPDSRSVDTGKFPVVPGKKYKSLFNQAKSRMEKIAGILHLDELPTVHAVRVVEESELERLNSWLGDVWATASSYEEQFRRLLDREKLVGQREDSLENFANLKVDLGLLQGDKQFLNLFVGTVPRENVSQLEEALGLANHLLYTFSVNSDAIGVIIAGPRSTKGDELNSILQAADFRILPVPPDLRSQPEHIRQEIADNRAAIVVERQGISAQLQSWAGSMHNELADAQRTLVLAEPFVQLDTAMRSAGSLSAVTGWVPESDLSKLEATLDEKLTGPFLLTTRSPDHDERTAVPTVMIRSRFFATFQDLICQYGVPRYGEIDPTPIFSITFILMFGAMFGDIGQGAVFVLLGWLLKDKLQDVSKLIIYLGLSSVTFGFLYGSIFGFEHVIPHIWVAPITDPTYMLTAALIFGVFFVVTMSLISIYNHVILGDTAEALFGHHGVASVVLYLSAVGGLYQLVQTGEFGFVATFLAIGAFAAIFGFSWYQMKGTSFGERFLVGTIGGMEIAMGYISNTLSFLRVAAFSLNHAALALAVFAIANMMQTTGYWVTVVIGNIFVMVLEGGIVTIQTMRLEYYEGFSRYYSGDGREYVPLKLRTAVAK